MSEHIKQFIDWVAVSTAAVTLLGWINVLLAIPAAIWTTIRIYEYFKSKK